MNGLVLIKKGAEADLYVADWHGRKVVLKRRLPKKYRQPALDVQVRDYRTVHEPQLIHEARRAGVPTPLVFLVDRKDATIIMEYVEGRQVKQVLGEVSDVERRRLCFRIGRLVGVLHGFGVIHGDLTTSNMILDFEGKVFFVDFGLGEKSEEVEARGVDLHLLRRALESTHFRFAEECFASVIEGYAEVLGGVAARSVLDKVREIQRRGRYVAERKERE
jgi:TP53 regulating kinase-like protein